MENKRIILIGHGASGKDHLKQRFVDRGFFYSISCTTRPPRDGEVHGKDYYFLSETEFKLQIEEGAFFEWTTFNGWYYGTYFEQLNRSDILILTRSGLEALNEEQRKSSMVIFIDIPEDIRRERLAARKDADDVERRLEADRIDFEGFTDYDLRITDPNF